jgi:hypothetical protein
VRGQWGIENGLHYRRDRTLREDHSQLRMGSAPRVLAILNNTVVGLIARQGRTNLAEARREFARSGWRELSPLLPLNGRTRLSTAGYYLTNKTRWCILLVG